MNPLERPQQRPCGACASQPSQNDISPPAFWSSPRWNLPSIALAAYLSFLSWGPPGFGQTSYERILRADKEPAQWLTYSGSYYSQRHSRLDQIQKDNVGHLTPKWTYLLDVQEKVEASPLVVDGVMYLTIPPNDVVALDTRSGKVRWIARYPVVARPNVCCGRVNRGLAILETILFMGTVDGHLVALNATDGTMLWTTMVAENAAGYSITLAPLAVKDKIIVGVAGAEYGIRGFLDAYDAKTGKRIWRFYTIPGPGETGHETWSGDAWKRGGGSLWVTGSFDHELNLTYWGVGNPSPNFNGDVRPGDNLYTGSVVALDVDSGELRWHFQFTPHDLWDWDAAQIPVLADIRLGGLPRKVMVWANRNGFFYLLDRGSGELLSAKPFVRQTWTRGLDEDGRPDVIAEAVPTREGVIVYPGLYGGTNWESPSYSPRTGLFYVPVREQASLFVKGNAVYYRNTPYLGGEARHLQFDLGSSAVRALDAKNGDLKWEVKTGKARNGGVLSTGGDLVFWGDEDGNVRASDARNGEILWHQSVGGKAIHAAPVSYLVDGEQQIAVTAGNGVFAFGLD